MACCGGGKEEKQQLNAPSLKTNKNKNRKTAKIVLLGNVAVGKTSLAQRYVNDKFEEKYYNTLGGAYLEKTIEKNNEQYSLNIWDTAGDERYRSIMPLYYRDAQVAILVYDVTDAQSFQDLNYWIEELDSKTKTEGLQIALIGNKNDVDPREKRITRERAENFAKEKNFFFQECSAKTGTGIEQIFEKIVENIDFGRQQQQQ